MKAGEKAVGCRCNMRAGVGAEFLDVIVGGNF